jgi:3-hydroxybutyryl-CoA dehydrogenase
MSTIAIIGDGPLAAQIKEAVEKAGYTGLAYLFNQTGPQFDPPVGLSEFMVHVEEAELVIEAIIGQLAYKQMVIQALGTTGALILSSVLNSSTTGTGGWLKQPERLVGWAALPPFEDADTIEVMAGFRTSPETLETARQFLASLGKEPVMVNDTTGGVLPRVVANLINEAAFALMEGVADPADIDQAMKLGTNYPHGPLEWADLIGIDQVAGILDALNAAYGWDRYRVAPLIKQMVSAGWWGQRTGRGFYTID